MAGLFPSCKAGKETMRVTSKSRYGLRLLLEVAIHQHNGPVTLADIALRQGISQRYLWQVITPLKSAGILIAKRGFNGGVVLGRDPSQITIRDIVDVLEGEVLHIAEQKDAAENTNNVFVAAHRTWSDIEKKVSAIAGGITLQDVLVRYQENSDGSNLNFII